jgi:recombination DNA repair RAD52 pathway protein
MAHIEIILVNGEKRSITAPDQLQADGQEQLRDELERARRNTNFIWTQQKTLVPVSAILEVTLKDGEFHGGVA